MSDDHNNTDKEEQGDAEARNDQAEEDADSEEQDDVEASSDQTGEEEATNPNWTDSALRTDGFALDPPAGSSERIRDSLLRLLDRPVFQVIGMIVIFLIIADGALFFFLLMGWHALCEPVTDCEPRNWWYNFSIHVLNVLFTYTNLFSMPWRMTNFLHISGWSCPYRSNVLGCNLYGMPGSKEVWFHIPLRPRWGITVLLLLNAITQFVNQGTRFYYYQYELQDVHPGNIWTVAFFGASFVCAGIAAAWMTFEASKVRKRHPGKFGPGPIDLMKEMIRRIRRRKTEADAEYETDGVDPTRERRRRSVLHTADRATLRMWAM